MAKVGFCDGGYARRFFTKCACGARGSEVCRAKFYPAYDPDMVAKLKRLDAEEPEATFASGADMMKYLDEPR